MTEFAFILRSNLRRHPEQAEALIQIWIEMVEDFSGECIEGITTIQIAEMLDSAIGISEIADPILKEQSELFFSRSNDY